MTDLDAERTLGYSIPALVATALLDRDLPDATDAELESASRYVDDSVAAMPDITRAGVRVASTLVYAGLSLLGRAPYRRQSPLVQAELAARLVALRLPVVAEFGRLTRGLGLVGVFERRTGPDAG